MHNFEDVQEFLCILSVVALEYVGKCNSFEATLNVVEYNAYRGYHLKFLLACKSTAPSNVRRQNDGITRNSSHLIEITLAYPSFMTNLILFY